MINRISVVTVFLAILSQTLFLAPNNVIYGNILSLPIAIPFAVLVYKSKKLVFSIPIILLISLNAFWFISLLWHPGVDTIPLSFFRPFIIVPIFIVILYNLLLIKECRVAMQWAFIACVYINFCIYLTGLGGQFWGDIYLGKRFQGTFENSNGAGMVFFAGLIFSFLYLNNKYLFVKVLAWLGIVVAAVLIIATASKKGLLLLAAAILLFLPLYLKNITGRQLVMFFCFLSLAFTSLFLFKTQLNLEDRWNLVSYRLERFTEDIDRSEYGGGSTAQRNYLIQVGLEHFWDKPLLGHGAMTFIQYFGRVAHNNFIELLFNGGLIAFLLYYGMHSYCLLKVRYVRDRNLRLMVLFLVAALLVADFAVVSYYTKFVLYILFYCIVTVEQETLNNKHTLTRYSLVGG